MGKHRPRFNYLDERAIEQALKKVSSPAKKVKIPIEEAAEHVRQTTGLQVDRKYLVKFCKMVGYRYTRTYTRRENPTRIDFSSKVLVKLVERMNAIDARISEICEKIDKQTPTEVVN